MQIDTAESEEENSGNGIDFEPEEEAQEDAQAKGEIDERVDENEEEERTSHEGVAPKVARDPGQPNAQERLAHKVTHVPYR